MGTTVFLSEINKCNVLRRRISRLCYRSYPVEPNFQPFRRYMVDVCAGVEAKGNRAEED